MYMNKKIVFKGIINHSLTDLSGLNSLPQLTLILHLTVGIICK